MSEPASKDDYLRRFGENQKLSGFGLDTTCHVPCPFCAAPDFITHRILETEEAYAKGAICKECGRGVRAEFRHPAPGHTVFEFVQFCGPDAVGDWLPPMRRVPDV